MYINPYVYQSEHNRIPWNIDGQEIQNNESYNLNIVSTVKTVLQNLHFCWISLLLLQYLL